MPALNKKEFERRLQQLESQIQAVDALEEGSARRSAVEAIQALLNLHGEVLERMLEVVAARGEPGEAIIREIAADEMAGGLLLLHGLHPIGVEERIAQALDRVRPYLATHGGNVELLEVTGGVARLRLQGSCHGCPSSTVTLKHAIEREIAEAAPDLVDLQVEGVVEQPAVPAGFVPLGRIKPVAKVVAGSEREGESWRPVAGLEGLASQETRIQEVSGAGVLFCRIGDDRYAYQEPCPACGQSLAEALLVDAVLRCGACGRRYDVRAAGRCLDDAAQHLRPVPLLVEGGQIKVAAAALAG